MDPQPNEKELLQKLKLGDTVAFDTLYNMYHAAIYLNVMKIIRDSDDAQDIVQDVFILLWKNRETIHQDRSVKGWLFVISYNRSIDHLRLKAKHATAMQELSVSMDPSEDPGSPEQVTPDLGEVIGRLSPQQKKVFEMCKLKEKTYQQVASELGISRFTVGEYLKKALAFIRANTSPRIRPN